MIIFSDFYILNFLKNFRVQQKKKTKFISLGVLIELSFFKVLALTRYYVFKKVFQFKNLDDTKKT